MDMEEQAIEKEKYQDTGQGQTLAALWAPCGRPWESDPCPVQARTAQYYEFSMQQNIFYYYTVHSNISISAIALHKQKKLISFAAVEQNIKTLL